MSYETILYEKKDGAARITYNRPERMNAMNDVCFRELMDAMNTAEKDDEVKVVVIMGQGKAFSAGVDLKWAKDAIKTVKDDLDFLKVGKALLATIEGLEKPVIAAVNGIAVAGGFEVITACDLAIAIEDIEIGDGHMKVGMFGAGGSPYRLAMLVGLRKAKELVLTGKRITGKEAAEIGLVNKAVPRERFEEALEQMIAELSGHDLMTMRVTKSYMNDMILTDCNTKVNTATLASIANNFAKPPKE